MASVVQEWVEQGIEIGVVKGKADGNAELLIELLKDHFGSLSKDEKEKIASADADTVGSWFSKAIKATNLDDISRVINNEGLSEYYCFLNYSIHE